MVLGVLCFFFRYLGVAVVDKMSYLQSIGGGMPGELTKQLIAVITFITRGEGEQLAAEGTESRKETPF